MNPRIVFPVVVLAASVVLAAAIVATREKVVPEPPAPFVPAVEVVVAEGRDVRLDVVTHGLVAPRTESRLVAQVAGLVLSVSPAFRAGGFFEQGEVLLRLDDVDLRAAEAAAAANLARTRSVLAQEEVAARLARDEWDAMGVEGEPDPVLLRVPQLDDARAQVVSARAALEKAGSDVARAVIRAPYPGRVREASVDVGQYVPVGTLLGTVYAVDVAEVRLPVRDDELRHLDLSLQFRGEDAPTAGPVVDLEADFAGDHWTWTGVVARTEGEIDPRTRALTVVVSVDDPYGRRDAGERPPLAAGLFVEGRIHGRSRADVITLPRAAARPGDTVWVVEDGVLRVRPVTWLRSEHDRVLVASGLQPGERVVVSSLEIVSDGMDVIVTSRPSDAAALGERP